MGTLPRTLLNTTRFPHFHGASNKVLLFLRQAFSFSKQALPISYPKQKVSTERAPSWNLSAMATSEQVSSKEETEHQTKETGVSDWSFQWLPVAFVSDLDKRKALAVTIMGKDFVVWWDNNGESWQVWEEKCPHRFAPLLEDKIDTEGELQCSSHGWCFAAHCGNCTFIPQDTLDGTPGPNPLVALRTQIPDTESLTTERAQLNSDDDTVDPAEPGVNLHEEISCVLPEKPSDGQSSEVLDISAQVQETSNDVVPGAGLVPYRDHWPASFSALSGGGQLVADLTTAWDGLAGKLSPSITSGKHMHQILIALKIAFAVFNRTLEGGRLMLVKSLSVAYTLADLQMDATVMAAGLLRLAVEAGLVGISEVDQQLDSDVGRLLHDCMRFKRTLDQMDLFDEESSKAVRQFCLSFHDIRSITIEYSYCLQQMRHVHHLPRFQQQVLALEALQVHAPLAHAIGTKEVSTELEDLAFKIVLPDSYKLLDNWLLSQWPNENSVLEECKWKLSSVLEHDDKLKSLTDSFTISGRLKSRYSIMKKLLKDGRKPEEVYDIVGLRVVISPKSGCDGSQLVEGGRSACYRVLEVVRSLWKEVPGRLKDYVAYPKFNGYESLHVAVYLADSSLTMELQIRTLMMDFQANDGEASHSMYKGGLTDSKQVQQLKKLMMVAADRAAFPLKELTVETSPSSVSASEDQVFLLFDKNKDGEISMWELEQVLGDLGFDGNEARELMQLVDTNKDGSVSVNEFAEFKKQVSSLKGFDKRFSNKLGSSLRGLIAGTAQEMPATM